MSPRTRIRNRPTTKGGEKGKQTSAKAVMASPEDDRVISDSEFVDGFFKLLETVTENRSWGVEEATTAALIARGLMQAEATSSPRKFRDDALIYRVFTLYCLKTNVGDARRFAGQNESWYTRYLADFRQLWGGRDWQGNKPIL